MNEKQLRQLLGLLAGLSGGTQASRAGLANKLGGAFSGGVAGLFAADGVNALRDLAYLKEMQDAIATWGFPKEDLDVDIDREIAIWSDGMRRSFGI